MSLLLAAGDDSQVFAIAGEAALGSNDVVKAEEYLKKAAALDPSATRPLEALGDVLYRRQRFKGAADVYQRRLGLDDRSEQVAYRLALARYRDGDIDATLAEDGNRRIGKAIGYEDARSHDLFPRVNVEADEKLTVAGQAALRSLDRATAKAQSSQGRRASMSADSTVAPHQIRRPAGASR